jgi:GDPmannose 4,6-dehydratase
MPRQRAFITGITGQDGSYLTELLLEKGYEVHGLVRRTSTINRTRIDHLLPYESGPDKRLLLHYGDLADGASLVKLLDQIQPDEIYNLASQSHVRVSFDIPEYTADITGVGTARILGAIVETGLQKKVRFYQASSSEIFGKVSEFPQRETTPFHPRSPYGCAKLFAHWLTVNYRESYGLYACSGISFSHESPRRGENFVTRKISLAAARIQKGLQQDLVLGNLDARRDWGYAKEYVEGMWRMLQQETPDDYVLATNEAHAVREFLEAAFTHAGLDWRAHVKFDERFLRPAEVDLMVGDYSKARHQLGWEPQTKMHGLARLMVDADLATLGG